MVPRDIQPEVEVGSAPLAPEDECEGAARGLPPSYEQMVAEIPMVYSGLAEDDQDPDKNYYNHDVTLVPNAPQLGVSVIRTFEETYPDPGSEVVLLPRVSQPGILVSDSKMKPGCCSPEVNVHINVMGATDSTDKLVVAGTRSEREQGTSREFSVRQTVEALNAENDKDCYLRDVGRYNNTAGDDADVGAVGYSTPVGAFPCVGEVETVIRPKEVNLGIPDRIVDTPVGMRISVRGRSLRALVSKSPRHPSPLMQVGYDLNVYER